MFSTCKNPMTPNARAITISIRMVWAALLFTIALFFAPAYCDINMVPAIEKPVHSAMMRKIIGPLIETAATASFPSFPTQYASTNWYALCSKFPIKIGSASFRSHCRIEPSRANFMVVLCCIRIIYCIKKGFYYIENGDILQG